MECLRRNAIPVLKTPIEDPPHSTGEPIYRDLIHSLPGLTSVPQNFDGNGPAIRYHAGFGDRTISTSLPGGEQLVGLTSESLLGSRPKFTDNVPPFRPTVPCMAQDRVDLRAETGPVPAAKPASIRRPLLARQLRDLAKLLTGKKR
jgi:hypothetical protein